MAASTLFGAVVFGVLFVTVRLGSGVTAFGFFAVVSVCVSANVVVFSGCELVLDRVD